MLYESIKKLVQYGIDTGLTPECERIYTTNLLLDVFHEDNWEDVSCDLTDLVLKDILADLLKEAVTRGSGSERLLETLSGISGIRHSVLLQVQSGQRLHPPVPDQKGPQMECRHRLRNTGYYHQSVQTGKRSESHCRCAQRFCFGLPEMSALYGERGVCRAPRSPGQRESPHHSDHGQ